MHDFKRVKLTKHLHRGHAKSNRLNVIYDYILNMYVIGVLFAYVIMQHCNE